MIFTFKFSRFDDDDDDGNTMLANLTTLVENVITCPVCLKHFDQPRMLPCSHTFCFQCLQNMSVQSDGKFECPKRDGIRVEGDAIDRLPMNEDLWNLIKLFRK